jgi:hypothetical protein
MGSRKFVQYVCDRCGKREQQVDNGYPPHGWEKHTRPSHDNPGPKDLCQACVKSLQEAWTEWWYAKSAPEEREP